MYISIDSIVLTLTTTLFFSVIVCVIKIIYINADIESNKKLFPNAYYLSYLATILLFNISSRSFVQCHVTAA